VLVDLVQTQTRDGVRLDGMLQLPPGREAPTEAFCLIHGTGSNFYSSTLFDSVAEHCLQRGAAVLRVNTRGHDGISTAITPQGGRRQGAAYECTDDCRYDIAAWVAWLHQYTAVGVTLLGHSLGAVKCLYALAQEPNARVKQLIAVSPPRLSYSWFCETEQGPAFLKEYARAEERIAAGQPGTLLEVKLPLSFVISAAGYVEKYGPDERYNFLKLLPGLQVPLLITLGEKEVGNNMAFQGLPTALAELRRPPNVAVIPGADHFYTGVRPTLLAALDDWLARKESE
jgi:pimeloyl-ACP methyl ester carboxylesterase